MGALSRSRGTARASPPDSSAAEQSPRTPGRKPPTQFLDYLLDKAFDAFAAQGYEGAGHDPFAPEEIAKTIDFIFALVFVQR